MEDGGAELRRLDRVLAAMRHERAADEDERREPVEQAELADRVGDVELGRAVGLPSAERRATAGPAARRGRRSPRRAAGWRGAMMVRRPGKRPASAWWHRRPMRLFARMRARRDPDRPAREQAGELRRAARGSAGGGRASNLRLPATPTRGAPSRKSRSASAWRLREAEGEAVEQRARDVRQARPAPERALRHAPVDEDERDAAPVELEDQCSARSRTRRRARGPAASGRGSDGHSAARRAARIGARRPAAGGGQ